MPEPSTPEEQTARADAPGARSSPGAAPTDPETSPTFGPPARPEELGVLGPYRVVKELGRGGMGVVYLAFDERLQRRVALKVLLPRYAAVPAAHDRFLREARAVAAITHDHVVTVHDVGERDGITFLVMPLLHGSPLDRYAERDGDLAVPEVLRIGREIALGLAAAHAAGVVHRDIKPGNIWIESPGDRAKILDFGLAKPARGGDPEQDLTATGAVLGTPAYMSPEQARGEQVDARADLFSLGAVLYRLCTKRAPFVGSTAGAVLSAVLTDPPAAVQQLNPRVPEALARLIHRLLEKRPENRPPSAAAVAELLQQIEYDPTPNRSPHGTPEPLTVSWSGERKPEPPPRPGTAPAGSGRRWALAAAALTVATAAAVVLVVWPRPAQGALVIEGADEGQEITVRRGSGVVFERTRLRELTLPAGDGYEIELVAPRAGVRLSETRFAVAKDGRTVVTVSTERPAPPPEPAREPLPFRELLGATPAELERWAEALPPGFRPAYVSGRGGKGPPRFDAVALPLPGEWHLSVADKDVPNPKLTREAAERCTLHQRGAAVNNGRLMYADLLLPAHGRWTWSWFNPDDSTADFLRGARSDPVGPRPTTIPGLIAGWCESFLWALGPPAPAWESREGLSDDGLLQAATEARARGWRLELLGVYSEAPTPLFRAVVSENSHGYDWHLAQRVPVGEMPEQVRAWRAKGFFPKSVCSNLGADGAVYTVLWLKEPPSFRRPSAAVNAALALGGEAIIEAGDTRVFVPRGKPLPDIPHAVLDVSFRGSRELGAGAERLVALPPTVETFDFADTDLNNTGLCGLAAPGRFPTLRYLFLNNSLVGDKGLRECRHFPKLFDLNLADTQIDGTGLDGLTGLRELESVNLDRCPKLTDAGAAHLGRVASLKRLYLYETNLSDVGVAHLAGLSKLEELSLYGPGVTDRSAEVFAKLPKLQTLYLGRCAIGDAGFARLRAAPTVRTLTVDNETLVTAKGLKELTHLPALKTLRLNGCGERVNDELIGGLTECKQLQDLELFGGLVTAAGVDKLAAAIPQCRIKFDGGVREPAKKP